ncbi:LuxR C-terminal-related transcriptional regulator [Paraconexibacter sp.]|uniref:LuxR C-terminal-related transcriptional regulator n=1 Tax=Paraconexibacter sp. TaxID=2949640 RepID=UPI0035690404
MGSVEQEWSDGPPLEDPGLAATVLDIWRDAAVLAADDPTGVQEPRDVGSAQQMLVESGAWLVRTLEDTSVGEEHDRRRAVAARLLLRHGRAFADIRDEGQARRLRGFAAVNAALARLRSIGDVEQMLTRLPVEVARCGFDRVMLTTMNGAVGTVHGCHIEGDPEWAAEIVRTGRSSPLEINHLLLESEMLRRRGPVLVPDAAADPRVHPELAAVAKTRSYVAAPIMPQGEVIGLIHADAYVARRTVDEVDRDLLWMFAEGFGQAYERAVLLTRLGALRQEVRRANSSILAIMDDFCDAEVEVARFDDENQSVARSAAAVFVAADSRLEALLTPRELDVIRLMALGETNGGIARKLVVSEGTVKSHVKHILRKLRASNRAEAVSRYVRLTQQDAQRG